MPRLITLALLLLAQMTWPCAAAPASSQKPRAQFINGQPWPDNRGIHINAHGGGILFYQGTYYWFGEHKTDGNQAHVGVHCYSSRDLYNWNDAGIALPVSKNPSSELVEGCVIERPKVIYNARTKKFVMWFHLELKGHRYNSARTAVAVAENATGPYTYLGSFRPDAGVWPMNVTEQDKIPGPDNLLQRDFEGGQPSRDMTLFVDDDDKAYHISTSEGVRTLHVNEFSTDYQSFTGRYTRIFPGKLNEASAICKHNGRYWMLTSGCTGWAPNAARSAVADSIFGPWKALGNPCLGVNPSEKLGPEKTFGGQSTCIFPVNGKPGAYIAMFDIWRPDHSIDSRYIWLPIDFEDDHFKIHWRDTWDLSFFKPSQPASVPSPQTKHSPSIP